MMSEETICLIFLIFLTTGLFVFLFPPKFHFSHIVFVPEGGSNKVIRNEGTSFRLPSRSRAGQSYIRRILDVCEQEKERDEGKFKSVCANVLDKLWDLNFSFLSLTTTTTTTT